MFDDTLKVLVLADEFKRTGWSDALNGVDVITTEEDTEVDKLANISGRLFKDMRM